MSGAVCYPTQSEALAAECSGLGAVDAGGAAITCTGVAAGASTSLGGSYLGTLNLRKTSSLGVVSNITRPSQVLACERYDSAYFAPLISAWVAALVAIVAARFLLTRVFSRETL
jgi:hypothetical protein